MSGRTGASRDARFLSGSDVGRTISFQIGDDLFGQISGTIYAIHHHEHWVDVDLGPGPATRYGLNPKQAVTITGADRRA